MTKAYVLLVCEPGSDDYVISQLRSINSVKDAHGTFGTYDVIARLEDPNEERLRNDITKQVRRMQKVRATLTLMGDNADDLFKKNLAQKDKEIVEQYSAQAYILLVCEKTKERKVLQELSKIPEVIEGDSVMGAFDAICKVVAPTFNEIQEIVTKKIRKIKGIKSTTTANVIG